MFIHRLPNGIGLLLVGSGIYWLLSGQLITSFTALSPGLLRHVPLGTILIVSLGVACIVTGCLTSLRLDLKLLHALLSGSHGWVYTLPILLAALDVEVTLIGLSYQQGQELNPFVAAAVSAGPVFLVPFIISYIILAEGLAILMSRVGQWLYKGSDLSNLPIALVCGVGSFGPFNNLALLTLPFFGSAAGILIGITGAVIVSFSVYRVLAQSS